MSKILFAIPKGSLEKPTFDFLEKAFVKIYGRERSYRPTSNDSDLKFKILRPQEIPIYVGDGLYDVGITGLDWVQETGADVKVLLHLEFGAAKLLMAIPKTINVSSTNELLKAYNTSKKVLRVSTEYPSLVSRYFLDSSEYKRLYQEEEPIIVTPWGKKGSNKWVQVYLSFGATEAKPPEEADAIADISETGTTLEQNGLKPIDVIVKSQAVLIANRSALKNLGKREKVYDIIALFRGVIESSRKLHIFLNVKEDNLQAVLSLLPGLKGPTVSNLSKPGWYAVNTIVDRSEYIKLLPKLRKIAQGLVVHEPQLIMPLEDIAREEEGVQI